MGEKPGGVTTAIWPGFKIANARSSSGTRGFKSLRRFDGARRIITPNERPTVSCWADRFLSTVMNTSNFPAICARSQPLRIPAHPSFFTVVTWCPASPGPSLRGRHSSRITRISNGACSQRGPGLLQELDNLFSGHRRKIIEKLVDRFPVFEIIGEVLERNPGSGENRSTIQNVGIGNDKRRFHDATQWQHK